MPSSITGVMHNISLFAIHQDLAASTSYFFIPDKEITAMSHWILRLTRSVGPRVFAHLSRGATLSRIHRAKLPTRNSVDPKCYMNMFLPSVRFVASRTAKDVISTRATHGSSLKWHHVVVPAVVTVILSDTVKAEESIDLDAIEGVVQLLGNELPPCANNESCEVYSRRCEYYCFDLLKKAAFKEEWWKLQAIDPGFLNRISDQENRSLLLVAAREGSQACVAKLLKMKIALNRCDSRGNTPLHLATEIGRKDIAALLLSHYHDKRNDKRELALHTAIRQGHDHLLDIRGFITSRSEGTTCSYQGNEMNPIALAVACGSIKCLEKTIALSNKANLSVVVPNAGTVLHVALLFDRLPMLQHLLSRHHAETRSMIVQGSGSQGCAPIHIAAERGYVTEIQLLYDKGCTDLAIKDSEGRTAATIAAERGNLESLEMLAYLGVNLDAKDGRDIRPEELLDGTDLARLSHLVETYNHNRNSPPDFTQQAPKNLVFQGGGPKGIVYVGALRALEDNGKLVNLKRVAGTSAGAITATFVALGFTCEEMETILLEFDLSTFLDPINEKDLEEALAIAKEALHASSFKEAIKEAGKKAISYLIGESIQDILHRSSLATINRLAQFEGLCEGERFRLWIEERIEEKTGIRHCTFKELREQIQQQRDARLKHLHVYAFCLSEQSIVCFNSSNEGSEWDDVIISDALRASMSIPLLFKPHQIHFKNAQGDRYPDPQERKFVDGGLVKNFPLDAFDLKHYRYSLGQQDWNSIVTNYETLGVCPKVISDQPSDRSIDGPLDLLKALCQLYYGSESYLREEANYNAARVIELPIEGVGLLDFDMPLEKKRELVFRGYSTIDEHFSNAPVQLDPGRVVKTNLTTFLPTFVERKELFASLSEKLSGKNTQASTHVTILFGLPGMGKTQAARHYSHRHRHEYSEIWVINCRTDLLRAESYRQIADKLRIPISPKTNPEELRRVVHSRLSSGDDKPWLLILDNVDYILDPQKDLPAKGGHVLVTTTREDAWDDPNSIQHVGPLSNKEAITLLKKITFQDESKHMQQLARDLGYFPLALNLAAHYIGQSISIADYIKEYEQQKTPIKARMEQGTRYKYVLNNVWNVTWKRIREEEPSALEWLNLCSQLSPDNIPLEWLEDWAAHRNVSSLSIIKTLGRYAVIARRSEDKAFSMHGLMQQVLKDEFSEQQHSCYEEAVSLAEKMLQRFDRNDPINWENARRSCQQAKWLVNSSSIELDIRLRGLYSGITEICWYSSGDYQMILECSKQSLKIALMLHPDINHPHVAGSLNNVGYALKALGRPQEALEYLEKALKMYQALHPDINHPHVAGSLNNVGLALEALGRPQEALEYLEKALKMHQALYPDISHPHVAASLNSVGLALKALGRSQEALEHFTQALEIYREIYPDINHPGVADSLNNVGLALEALGRSQEALEYLEKALKMHQALYPDISHPHVAVSLNNVGLTLKALERPQEALEYLEKALKMRQALYPDINHPHVAHSLNNVGLTLKALERPQEALEYLEKALKIHQALYPDINHPHVADSLNNVGLTLKALGRPQEALEYLEKALKMRQALYPDVNHPGVADSLNNVGYALAKLGRSQEALEHFTQGLEIYREIYPENHPKIQEILQNIAKNQSWGSYIRSKL